MIGGVANLLRRNLLACGAGFDCIHSLEAKPKEWGPAMVQKALPLSSRPVNKHCFFFVNSFLIIPGWVALAAR